MHLKSPKILTVVDKKQIRHYISQQTPVILKNFAHRWKAQNLWTPEYLQNKIKDIKVPLYNNVKSDAYTPVNTADDYMSFSDYIQNILQHPEHKWRLFLFNIYTQAPELLKDFDYPTDVISPIIKQAPMLFIGGKGSITHIHFDIDYSTVLHVQIYGRKKFLLFPFDQQHLLYRKPFEVLSWVDFSNYAERINELETQFPKLKEAQGYEVILEPSDALIMPPGFWHHIEYLENSIAISMRAINTTPIGILKGLWYLIGMRNIDTFMKKHFPIYWNNYKVHQTPYFDSSLKEKFLLPNPPSKSLSPQL
jgi:hypothetical protein